MKKVIKLLGLLLIINSVTSAQFLRKVLFEEATNASCGPCAANNPILKAYIDSKGDTIIAIKYHTSFPGYDPMYLHNPTQNFERYSTYYNMNAVPWLNVDGIINDVWPFNLTNFNNAYYTRLAIPAPLMITVSDVRIAGDSIRSTITVNLPSNLPSGNYRLRVMAIEGWVIYQTPPGSNGETHFEHVFRRAYPNTLGTSFPGTAGAYQYIFTYKRDPVWNDTSIYTVAFIQNDNNKEVLNCARGKYFPLGVSPGEELPKEHSLSQNYPNPFNSSTKIVFSLPKDTYITLKIFDITGREISLLAKGWFKTGKHELDWDATEVTSGIYFYTLFSEKFSQTRKMILIK